MSVSSGFYNSLNGDRLYNADQFSRIFDGIINDGVLATIGNVFAVAVSSNIVTVDSGRAWLNGIWVVNDAPVQVAMPAADVVYGRYDMIAIEVNKNDATRAAFIKAIKGTASANPQRPTPVRTELLSQYPLAYIYRAGGSASIAQADITNTVGTSQCPYVTGLLQVVSIDNIVAQWKDMFDTWFNEQRTILDDDVAIQLSNRITNLDGAALHRVLTPGTDYGSTLPAAGTPGRIFFKKD